MRGRQLLNDIMHSDELAIVIVLHCSLQPTKQSQHRYQNTPGISKYETCRLTNIFSTLTRETSLLLTHFNWKHQQIRNLWSACLLYRYLKAQNNWEQWTNTKCSTTEHGYFLLLTLAIMTMTRSKFIHANKVQYECNRPQICHTAGMWTMDWAVLGSTVSAASWHNECRVHEHHHSMTASDHHQTHFYIHDISIYFLIYCSARITSY